MKKIKGIFLLWLCFTIFSGFTSQLFKTSLKINVRNELGNTESQVKVALYKNQEDYEASENPVASGETDAKGNVTFQELEPTVYYINAEKGDKNNYGAGEKTDSLTANRLNKLTIIISE